MEKHRLHVELEQFENQLWYFHQYVRTLQEHRMDLALSWDDNASTEINGRFLDPHREDNEKLEDNFRNQYQKLVEVANHFVIISKKSVTVNELSKKIDISLLNCTEDINRSLTTLEDAKEKRFESEECLKSAKEALAKAQALK